MKMRRNEALLTSSSKVVEEGKLLFCTRSSFSFSVIRTSRVGAKHERLSMEHVILLILSRSGEVMTDFDAFGFEWQVNCGDRRIFQEAREPQLPYEKCRMPTVGRLIRRKLRGQHSGFHGKAKEAC